MNDEINKLIMKSTEVYFLNFLYKQKLLEDKEYEELKKIL